MAHSQPIGSLLRSLRTGQAVLRQVERLAAMQDVYAKAVPHALAIRSKVAYETAGTVVVLAETSAVATKLRQLAPRVVSALGKKYPEVNSIRLELQVTQGPPRPSGERPNLGRNARASLCALRDSLQETSPLRTAIERLLHHPKGD